MTIKKLILCLTLVLYVLGLSACGPLPKSDVDDSTGANSESATQNTENIQIPLKWQSTIAMVALKESIEPEISRLTYDSYRELVDAAAQKHSHHHEDDFCYFPDTGECKILNRLKSIDYSEDFFAENTLFLITFWGSEPFAVNNVTCEGDTLTCTLDIYSKQPSDTFDICVGFYWLVLITVDGVLHEEMRFNVVKNIVPLEREVYTKVSNEFFEKYEK